MKALGRPSVKTTYAADIDTPNSDSNVIYTVLAKDNFRWRTVLRRTEDIEHARLKMTEANLSQKFERVIICKAHDSSELATYRWETVECAVRTLNETKEAIRLSNDVRQDLRRIDTGLCVVESPVRTAFGQRQTISPEKIANKKTFGFVGKLKKAVEYA